MRVHPTYDPLTRTWFCEGAMGRTVEAKSLRELAGKLPPDAEIADYHPAGDWRASPVAPDRAEHKLRPELKHRRPKDPVVPELVAPEPIAPAEEPTPEPEPEPRSKPDNTVRNDKILVLLARGKSFKEISRELGVSPGIVAGVRQRSLIRGGFVPVPRRKKGAGAA